MVTSANYASLRWLEREIRNRDKRIAELEAQLAVVTDHYETMLDWRQKYDDTQKQVASLEAQLVEYEAEKADQKEPGQRLFGGFRNSLQKD